jgi:hypothetical protein
MMHLQSFIKGILFLICLLYTNFTQAQALDGCAYGTIARIQFSETSIKLTAKAKKRLDSTVLIIKMHPTCGLALTAAPGYECELCNIRNWDRATAIVNYLIKKGLSAKQIMFKYNDSQNQNEFSLVHNGNFWELPETSPHPNLKKKS